MRGNADVVPGRRRPGQECEEHLADPDRAIALWEEVLAGAAALGTSDGRGAGRAGEGYADPSATAALERLYAARERWADLASLLERRAQATTRPGEEGAGAGEEKGEAE